MLTSCKFVKKSIRYEPLLRQHIQDSADEKSERKICVKSRSYIQIHADCNQCLTTALPEPPRIRETVIRLPGQKHPLT